MTEQTGSTTPPDWYTTPPAWLQQPPARRDRDDRDRDYGRDRDSRGDDARIRELETRIAGMPEAVVNALKEAIQGATQSQQSAQQQTGQQQTGQQGEAASGQQNASNGQSGGEGDATPRGQLSFAEKWFSNSLGS
jgi:hypothetical protein